MALPLLESLPEVRAAQKAANMLVAANTRLDVVLDDAVETGAAVATKVQEAPIVRAVSTHAGALAGAVSGWANKALEEGREFIAIQQF